MERFLKWFQWSGLWGLSACLLSMGLQSEQVGDDRYAWIAFCGGCLAAGFLAFSLANSINNKDGGHRGQD